MAATENVYKLGRQRGPGDRSPTRRAWDQPLYTLYSNIIPVVKKTVVQCLIHHNGYQFFCVRCLTSAASGAQHAI